jgi:hypothetical protein
MSDNTAEMNAHDFSCTWVCVRLPQAHTPVFFATAAHMIRGYRDIASELSDLVWVDSAKHIIEMQEDFRLEIAQGRVV